MAPSDHPTSKGQAWFCTTGLPSDIIIEVEDMTFHLHKFPLMSKSRKLHEMITEQETNATSTRIQKPAERDNDAGDGDEEIEEEAEEIEEDQQCCISFPDFPGGSETFETAAKFCYGVKIELSASNVAPLRCAGEYLEMTEEYSEDNLISKTERFLSQTVLKSIKDSIKTLNSCKNILPLSETLGIVQRCIDAVAVRASAADPSLFGWPVNDAAIEANTRRKGASRTGGMDSWFEELGHLSLPLFKRLISAMKCRDLSSEVIESCLMYYAKKYIPGISRSSRKASSSSIPSENEQRELLETIITNLPEEKSSNASTATRILFGLLRTANILNASEASRAALERKIGSQLEQATLDDLLIPSYSYLNETLYDVACVERILGYFLNGLEERLTTSILGEEENNSVRSAALMLVGKLIDGYLSEIASDNNLLPEKFCELAVALPDQARLFDDGLYRAVDVYLKAHSWISEAERERICGVMDCQKLTLEACTHAAQNERLPLRAVVQVLFFEQLQLRQAIAGTLMVADVAQGEIPRLSILDGGEGDRESGEEEETTGVVGVARAQEGSSTWRNAVRENQVLRLDMDSMRTRVQELERECSTMKKTIQKIDKVGKHGGAGGGEKGGGWRSKLGCKFKTQVCDSHEPTVVEGRKGRDHRHRQ
ncbi:PREDICTED: BTB/POZ domain-containing protein At5g66560 [Nicotiana attenuata]|uniref:Btbpoz domain-containing protein n=1 Tax=Nicotiana attenuata TaxID=49451 RepID=A0A314L310_NICAT|nr:PREDICTED: BTB/POZ domain-containing protein At5g66560 [Nicotiana attenuata]OIT36048.1 btbpoz domain-containing protein [Nicotiana attenuata]